MPSRRDVLATAGAVGLPAAAAAARADDRSTTTPTAPDEEPGTDDSSREETDWPMYRHDPGNSGAAPGADVPTRRPPVAWSAQTAGSAAPAVTVGRIVTGGKAVMAFDPRSGARGGSTSRTHPSAASPRSPATWSYSAPPAASRP